VIPVSNFDESPFQMLEIIEVTLKMTSAVSVQHLDISDVLSRLLYTELPRASCD